MRVFASVLTSGRNLPASGGEQLREYRCRLQLAVGLLAAAVVLVAAMGTGCDAGEPPVDEQAAERHAEFRAEQLAHRTLVQARDRVLLHPDSPRQKHSEEQLQFLEDYDDLFEDHDDTEPPITEQGDHPVEPDDEPAGSDLAQ